VNALVKYEAALHAIMEARTSDEIMKIRATGSGLQEIGRAAKNKTMETYGAEIRIRAERRLGEMIAWQKGPDGPGLNQGGWSERNAHSCGAPEEPQDRVPRLDEVGIDKKLSSRSQAIASIPEDQFEETLAKHRDSQRAVTSKTMERLARQGKEAQEKENNEEKEEQEKDNASTRPSTAMQHACCAVAELRKIRNDDPNRRNAMNHIKQWVKENE